MKSILKKFNLETPYYSVSTGETCWEGNGDTFKINSPVDGLEIGHVQGGTISDFDNVMNQSKEAFKIWRTIPAPQRGEIVRQFGEALRQNKEDLGALVSYEMGKSLQEGYGEVQEMIDICDFAVGLSRQLYGLQMHSERPGHRMMEQWHPLGVVGIISAFNFPVAVWAWNTALAWICGNVCVWKPSEKTPFTALACQQIIKKVLLDNDLPEGISNLIIGGRDIGQEMASHPDIALVSATGSTRMGKSVAETVARRLGKSILELGGNNAIIVTENADLKHAIPSIVFGAVGTAGQRCTSTRRLIIHKSQYDNLVNQLVKAYEQLHIGNPLDESNHVGPLIDTQAVEEYKNTIQKAIEQGGKVLAGNKVLAGEQYLSGCYVKPTIIEANVNMTIVKHETFAPILYVMTYTNFTEAIKIQNSVPQGLSSSIFTLNIRESEEFLSYSGSDCGIANVNIGTSGAEIGGAFGGEKETGGGRESGSDAWKAYMRRQTCTVNYGKEAHLAQGIVFNF
ncbi:aldehyde dehydrogenase family protein [Sabulilitoribacter arenilitoris]|uniref:aldehyde dehydrogenase (NAD(+)) n=1 Tax=Wocania arenilitoris TaxID=2044858 RepID=A0AAE3ELI2_9FLAO|nr:aldehyde dehydrogenase family protein [Wocania arenilitoris]MCF7567072.1 aldehyde dehydrogenase family protein [Wocania arenilitoris]